MAMFESTARMSSTKLFTICACWLRWISLMSVGGWKWPKRLIATFGVEVVGDDEQSVAVEQELPGERFRLVLKAAFVGSSLPTFAESSGTPPLSTTVVAVADPSRTIDEVELRDRRGRGSRRGCCHRVRLRPGY